MKMNAREKLEGIEKQHVAGGFVPNAERNIAASLHEIRTGLEIVEGFAEQEGFPPGVRGIIAIHLGMIARRVGDLEDLVREVSAKARREEVLEL